MVTIFSKTALRSETSSHSRTLYVSLDSLPSPFLRGLLYNSLFDPGGRRLDHNAQGQNLLASRPEVPIRYDFCQIPHTEHRDFILHDIEASIVDHDISIFLDHEIGSIREKRSLGAG
jgi:hypothetical protein